MLKVYFYTKSSDFIFHERYKTCKLFGITREAEYRNKNLVHSKIFLFRITNVIVQYIISIMSEQNKFVTPDMYINYCEKFSPHTGH